MYKSSATQDISCPADPNNGSFLSLFLEQFWTLCQRSAVFSVQTTFTQLIDTSIYHNTETPDTTTVSWPFHDTSTALAAMKTRVKRPVNQMSDGLCEHHVLGCKNKATVLVNGSKLCDLCAKVGCQHHTGP